MTLSDSGRSNPYVGPRTFTRTDADRYFGREREAREIFSLVVSERLTLFYAMSGAGKSSLLQTRLLPQLQEAGFATLPVGRVGGDLPAGVTEVDNVFLFNLMLSLDPGAKDPSRFCHLSLMDFLHGLTSEDGIRFAYAPASQTQQAEPEGFGSWPYLLIIDQFEELFTTQIGRWAERADFFRQLDAAMAADPDLWVVLTLREDYVAALDPFAALVTDKMRSRFYMQRMEVEAALAAIKEPAAATGRPFAPGVAEELTDNLRQIRSLAGAPDQLGQYVEPVQLQVVCYQLWEKLPQEDGAAISHQDLAQAGDVDSALAAFYENALAAVLADPHLALSERALRRWVNGRLITEAGTRGTVYQGEMDTGGIPNRVVEILQARFLLRTELRAGGAWVELIHDRFVAPILQANAHWQAMYVNPVANAFLHWMEENQSSQRLLRGFALQEAEIFARQHPTDLTGDERDFLWRSREAQDRLLAEERRKIRNRRIIAGFAVILLITLSGLTAWALNNADLARRNALEAQRQEESARLNAEEAQHQAELADQNAMAARAQEQLALSREVSAYAISGLQTDPELSVLLAVQAFATAPTNEAIAALHQAVQNSHILKTLTGPAPFLSAHFNTSGDRILTAAQDGMVTLWETETGRALASWLAHPAPVWEAIFSPDGQLIATAGEEGVVKLWDGESRGEIRRLMESGPPVSGLAFSPDGSILATASWDGIVRLWEVASGSLRAELTGHRDAATRVLFSRDGLRVASVSDDGTARIWDVQSEALLAQLSDHHNNVYDMAFGPTSNQVVTAGWDGWALLWDLAEEPAPSGHKFAPKHTDQVHAVAFSPDGKWVVTGGDDRLIHLWDVESQEILLTFPGYKGKVTDLQFHPDGTRLLSASEDGTLRLWTLLPDGELVTLRRHQQAVSAVTFIPPGDRLATVSEDGTGVIWETAGWQPLHTFTSHDGEISALAVSADGSRLATGGDDNIMRVWDGTSGQLVSQSEPRSYWVWALAFDPAGDLVAAGGVKGSNEVDLFDAPTGELLRSLPGHQAAIRGLDFHPQDGRLLSVDERGGVRIWQAESGQLLFSFTAVHQGLLSSAAFDPAGQRIITMGDDGTARLWDAQTGAPLLTLTGHNARIAQAAFSPTNSILATASADRTVRLWGQDGEELYTLLDQTAALSSLDFSLDGRLLAVAGMDSTVRILLMDAQELIQLAQKRVTRDLTEAECQKVLRQACPME